MSGGAWIKERLRDQRGSVGITMLFIVCGMLLIILVVTEYQRLGNVRDNLHSDLDRTLSIAVEAAMMDAYRSEHAGQINPQIAIDYFYDELHNTLGLDSGFRRTNVKGEILYTLDIKNVIVHEESARLELIAEAVIPTTLGQNLTLPIELITKNRRLE